MAFKVNPPSLSVKDPTLLGARDGAGDLKAGAVDPARDEAGDLKTGAADPARDATTFLKEALPSRSNLRVEEEDIGTD